MRLQSVIMEGTFAKIYKGTVLGIDGSEEKAVIKTVNGNSIFANILFDIYDQAVLQLCVVYAPLHLPAA